MRGNKLTSFFNGYVTVELIGGNVSALINAAQAAGVVIWDISWQKKGHAVCSLQVRDFRRFRKIARSAGVKFHILHKHGFPFFLVRLEKRKFFVFGFIIFLIALVVASNMVWDVDVEGNDTVPDEEVVRLAREAGVYPGQWQFRLEDNDTIQRKLMLKLSDASWVGVRIQGTRAIITVVEKRKVDDREREEDSGGPYDLVASRSATIADLSGVQSGRVLVDYNQAVKKGQRLVSGVYGNDESESQMIAGAKGVVIGETWYETTVAVPLQQERKVYTGEREISRYPYIGRWSLRMPLLERVSYDQYDTVRRVKTLHFRQWKLPFGMIEAEHMETNREKVVYPAREAEQLALARAKQDVLSRLGPHGSIQSSKILQKDVKDGKVMLKILFTVRENIAEQRPILLEKSEDDT